MSRTDVHRPTWVMATDPHCRRWFFDQHNHSTGPCDLADYLASRSEWIRTRCYRLPGYWAPNLCGCWMCTGRHGRKLRHRQARTAWRAHRQRLLAAADWEDADVPPIYGSAY